MSDATQQRGQSGQSGQSSDVNVSDAIMAFGCGPVLRLAYESGIIDSLPNDIPQSGNISFTYDLGDGEGDKKYEAALDVVDRDYMLDIARFNQDPKLTHILGVLFNSAIAAHKTLSLQGVIPTDATIYIDMDSTTLYFGEDQPRRVGLRINEVPAAS